MTLVHGVVVQQQTARVNPARQSDPSIIGVIGFASQGPVGVLTPIRTEADIEQFGAIADGFGLATSLKAIFAQGPQKVYAINVLHATDDTDEVEDESLTITNGAATTAFIPVGTAFSLTNAAGSTTYTKNTHYTVDAYGRIKVLDFTTIAEGSTALATYNKKVLGSTINDRTIGAVTSGGVRTGTFLFDTAKTIYGDGPKIFLCPDLETVTVIQNALLATAERLKGVCILGLPNGTALNTAIAGRGASGTLGTVVKSDDERAIVCYPQVSAYDGKNALLTQSLAPFVAGVIGTTDRTRGYWYSPSNKPIKGIEGVERVVTWSIDGNSDANALNVVGIVTVANIPGKGYHVWGNNNAAYPTNTQPINFISVARTRDIIDETIQGAVLPFLDNPTLGTTSVIDSIKETANTYLRGQITIGAIADGRCDFVAEDNPAESVAAGVLVFRTTFLPPSPAQTIIFKSFVDLTLGTV